MRKIIYIVCLLNFGLMPKKAHAQLPEVLSYQGVLQDSLGNYIDDGSYNFTFMIYGVATGGQPLHSESQNVQTVKGVFDAYLGQTSALTLSFGKQYWLELQIEGVTLTPRIELTATAYSLLSINVPDSLITTEKIENGYAVRSIQGSTDSLNLQPGTNVSISTSPSNNILLEAAGGGNTSPWQVNGDDIYHSTGRVGIGTSSPREMLDVRGNLFIPTQIGAFAFAGVLFSGAERFMFTQFAENIEAETIFIGSRAGNFDPAGHSNIGIGFAALSAIGDRSANIAVGSSSLSSLESGGSNTAFGARNLLSLVAGNNNIALGSSIGGNTSAGANSSIAIGFNMGAGGSNQGLAIGNYGNLTGNQALQIGTSAETDGIRSSAIGYGAQAPLDNNIIFGDQDITVLETAGELAASRFAIKSLRLKKIENGSAMEVIKRRSIGELITLERSVQPLDEQDFLQVEVPANTATNFSFIKAVEGTNTRLQVTGNGKVLADGNYVGPADFAEMIMISSGAASAEAGDVLVIDPSREKAVKKASVARSAQIAGVYSTKPGFVGSEREWEETVGNEVHTYDIVDMAVKFNEIPMAIIGIVPCKVSTENGAIYPGDLLVTSSTPGHAMRDDKPQNGTVLGKALEAFSSGSGLIHVLVKLQ
ncbi:MAG: hypothetical protein ACRBF0_23060 [Calditrichia bacterium]